MLRSYFPASLPPDGVTALTTATSGCGLVIRPQMRARIDEGVPVGLLGDDLAAEEAQDHIQRLGHAVALGVRIDPEHQRVRRQQAGTGTEHDAAARMVVELDDAVRSHQRVMVRQRDHARAKTDRAGAFGGNGDEQLGRADQLPAGGMVLADPGLVEAKPVQPLHQLEIAVHAGGGILVHRMEWRQENAVSELDWGHDRPQERRNRHCARHVAPPQGGEAGRDGRGTARKKGGRERGHRAPRPYPAAELRMAGKKGVHTENPEDHGDRNCASREALRFFFLSAFSVVLGALRVNLFSSLISDSPQPDA